jgi:hypothetical protein
MKNIFLLFLLLPGHLIAQDSIYGNFVLSVNSFIFQNKEPVMNGQANQCIGFTMEAGWEGIRIDRIHHVVVDLGASRPKSDYEPVHFSVLANLEFRYEYLTRIRQTVLSQFFLGGMASIHYRMGYYPLWDDSHPYWATSFSAGVALRFENKFKDATNWFTSFNMPLIGLVSRPPLERQYKIDNPDISNILKMNHSEMGLATLNRYADLMLKTGFKLNYSTRYANEFYFLFNFLSLNTSYSKPYREIQIGAGITFIL